ncbi:MAG: polyketide synthase dehydratase domain-containing protein, partial [Planctomycetota bacterium]
MIAGRGVDVDCVLREMQADGVRVKDLATSHAFHSPLMDEILDEFEQCAAEVQYQRPRIAIVSNVTGEIMKEAPNARYWRNHIRRTVQFAAGMQTLMSRSPDVIMEIGPSPVLLAMGRRVADPPPAIHNGADGQADAAWLPSLRQGQSDWQVVNGSLAELYRKGARIRWSSVCPPDRSVKIDLPTYPFERQSHWYEETSTNRRELVAPSQGGMHPLVVGEIGTPLEDRLFSAELSPATPGFLAEHRVHGAAVTPAAAYLEQALTVADQLFGDGNHVVSDVSLEQAMVLTEGQSRRVQLAAGNDEGTRRSLRIYSQRVEVEKPGGDWELHVCAKLNPEPSTPALSRHALAGAIGHPRDFLKDVAVIASGDEFYAQMRAVGLDYGSRFQLISRLAKRSDEALATIEVSPQVSKEAARYHIHPALLDACLQAIAGVVDREPADGPATGIYLPVFVGRLQIQGDVATAKYVYARRLEAKEEALLDGVESYVSLLDGEGRPLVELERVRLQKVG